MTTRQLKMIDLLEVWFGPGFQQQIVSGAFIGAVVRAIDHKGRAIEKLAQFWVGFLTGLGITRLCLILVEKVSDIDVSAWGIVLGMGFLVGKYGVEGAVKLTKYLNIKSILLTLLKGNKKNKLNESDTN